jgi:hypothetical protein
MILFSLCKVLVPMRGLGGVFWQGSVLAVEMPSSLGFWLFQGLERSAQWLEARLQGRFRGISWGCRKYKIGILGYNKSHPHDRTLKTKHFNGFRCVGFQNAQNPYRD